MGVPIRMCYIGKSTDPKPNDAGWVDQLWFLEIDTGDVYLFINDTWVFQYRVGIKGDGVKKVTVGDTPDPSPVVGDLWVDTS